VSVRDIFFFFFETRPGKVGQGLSGGKEENLVIYEVREKRGGGRLVSFIKRRAPVILTRLLDDLSALTYWT